MGGEGTGAFGVQNRRNDGERMVYDGLGLGLEQEPNACLETCVFDKKLALGEVEDPEVTT